MTIPLSIHNLMHGGWRTVLSVVGISIAIILIFMQLGFLGAVTDTAVVFYDEMEFDLLVCSPDYYNFVDSGRFSRRHLTTIESVDGVVAVHPLHVSLGKWNYEQQQVQRGMLILGVDPHHPVFKQDQINHSVSQLGGSSEMLIDRSSRPKFLGSENRSPFSENDIGLQIELNGVTCRLAGLFDIGTGLAADGAAIVTENQFKNIIPNYGTNQVALGLIQLDPRANVAVVKSRILEEFSTLPNSQLSILVATREEMGARESEYWQWGTPIGFIFLAGSIVAFVVGAIIVYIVLSSDISKQIGEYATLKAMGYRNQFLSRTVLEQAFVLAMVSYLLATVISLFLYQIVGGLAKLPISMTGFRLALVLVSSVSMSFLSALIAMQKLRRADPADLF